MKQDYFDAKTKRLIGQAKRKKAVYLEIKRNNNVWCGDYDVLLSPKTANERLEKHYALKYVYPKEKREAIYNKLCEYVFVGSVRNFVVFRSYRALYPKKRISRSAN
jgi:hypothetical protein